MTNTINRLLEKMWVDYTNMNPQAKKIYDLFTSKGEKVENDHIALRTFNDPRVNVDTLAKPFLQSGYVFKGDYVFEEKKLKAKHYEHTDEKMPKIFISELELEKLSPKLQATVKKMLDEVPASLIAKFDFTSTGRPWKCTSEQYNELAKESEYASWVAAWGYRPNHFTVFINSLKKFSDLPTLNTFLKTNGFKLNSSGGEIKGTPEVFLEQSSTMANDIEVKFDDKTMTIPGCYYEFAKRYNLPNGKLYQGFVAKSADKIFESTFKNK